MNLDVHAISFHIINIFTTVIGGILLTVGFTVSICCVLNALLVFSEEYRTYFVRCLRAIGILIAFTGLLLPFRQTVHPIATLIALWWCALFNDFIPYYELFQFIGLDIVSWVFWCYFLSVEENEELIFLLKMGDFTIFVVLPTVFGLVMLSKSTNTLDSDYKSSRKSNKMNNEIPLRSFIGKLAATFRKLIPPN